MERKEIIGDCRLTWIYALCERGGENPRYVGKTCRGLNVRHKGHIADGFKKRRLPVHRWVAREHEAVRGTCIRALEIVAADADWAAREKFWIRRLREQGHDLLNLTEGGEGHAGIVWPAERREKVAAKLRTGASFDCETCGASFWRKRNEIDAGDCRFCSRPCYAASLKGVSRPVSAVCTERGVAAAAFARKARTECKRGHPLSGENLFKTSSGARGCKACRRLHKAAYLERTRG